MRWENNLHVNTSKIKELVVDFQCTKEPQRPFTTQWEEAEVGQVSGGPPEQQTGVGGQHSGAVKENPEQTQLSEETQGF